MVNALMAIYQIGSKITHESLDGEVIAIHFDTGAYYSLRGSSARIWETLAAAASSPETIATRFEGSSGETLIKIETFLKSLCEEGLIKEAPEAVSVLSEKESKPALLPFEDPVFERFNDMRDLLLADPIHEVDEGGWPHVQS